MCLICLHKILVQTVSCVYSHKLICWWILWLLCFFTQQAADAVVHPRLLSDANVYFTLFDEVNRGGKIIGSNILLESGGRAYINAALNGFEKQTCTIIFNSTLFDQLNLSLWWVPYHLQCEVFATSCIVSPGLAVVIPISLAHHTLMYIYMHMEMHLAIQNMHIYLG